MSVQRELEKRLKTLETPQDRQGKSFLGVGLSTPVKPIPDEDILDVGSGIPATGYRIGKQVKLEGTAEDVLKRKKEITEWIDSTGRPPIKSEAKAYLESIAQFAATRWGLDENDIDARILDKQAGPAPVGTWKKRGLSADRVIESVDRVVSAIATGGKAAPGDREIYDGLIKEMEAVVNRKSAQQEIRKRLGEPPLLAGKDWDLTGFASISADSIDHMVNIIEENKRRLEYTEQFLEAHPIAGRLKEFGQLATEGVIGLGSMAFFMPAAWVASMQEGEHHESFAQYMKELNRYLPDYVGQKIWGERHEKADEYISNRVMNDFLRTRDAERAAIGQREAYMQAVGTWEYLTTMLGAYILGGIGGPAALAKSGKLMKTLAATPYLTKAELMAAHAGQRLPLLRAALHGLRVNGAKLVARPTGTLVERTGNLIQDFGFTGRGAARLNTWFWTRGLAKADKKLALQYIRTGTNDALGPVMKPVWLPGVGEKALKSGDDAMLTLRELTRAEQVGAKVTEMFARGAQESATLWGYSDVRDIREMLGVLGATDFEMDYYEGTSLPKNLTDSMIFNTSLNMISEIAGKTFGAVLGRRAPAALGPYSLALDEIPEGIKSKEDLARWWFGEGGKPVSGSLVPDDVAKGALKDRMDDLFANQASALSDGIEVPFVRDQITELLHKTTTVLQDNPDAKVILTSGRKPLAPSTTRTSETVDMAVGQFKMEKDTLSKIDEMVLRWTALRGGGMEPLGYAERVTRTGLSSDEPLDPRRLISERSEAADPDKWARTTGLHATTVEEGVGPGVQHQGPARHPRVAAGEVEEATYPAAPRAELGGEPVENARIMPEGGPGDLARATGPANLEGTYAGSGTSKGGETLHYVRIGNRTVAFPDGTPIEGELIAGQQITVPRDALDLETTQFGPQEGARTLGGHPGTDPLKGRRALQEERLGRGQPAEEPLARNDLEGEGFTRRAGVGEQTTDIRTQQGVPLGEERTVDVSRTLPGRVAAIRYFADAMASINYGMDTLGQHVDDRLLTKLIGLPDDNALAREISKIGKKREWSPAQRRRVYDAVVEFGKRTEPDVHALEGEQPHGLRGTAFGETFTSDLTRMRRQYELLMAGMREGFDKSIFLRQDPGILERAADPVKTTEVYRELMRTRKRGAINNDAYRKAIAIARKVADGRMTMQEANSLLDRDGFWGKRGAGALLTGGVLAGLLGGEGDGDVIEASPIGAHALKNFFSALRRSVEQADLPMKRLKGGKRVLNLESVEGYVKSIRGIKKPEMEWVFDPALKELKGSIDKYNEEYNILKKLEDASDVSEGGATKQDLLDAIDRHSIRVEEETLFSRSTPEESIMNADWVSGPATPAAVGGRSGVAPTWHPDPGSDLAVALESKGIEIRITKDDRGYVGEWRRTDVDERHSAASWMLTRVPHTSMEEAKIGMQGFLQDMNIGTHEGLSSQAQFEWINKSIPGGDPASYREVKFLWDDPRAADYEDPHYNERKMFAHMRYDFAGKEMNVHELQSQWMNDARHSGGSWDDARVEAARENVIKQRRALDSKIKPQLFDMLRDIKETAAAIDNAKRGRRVKYGDPFRESARERDVRYLHEIETGKDPDIINSIYYLRGIGLYFNEELELLKPNPEHPWRLSEAEKELKLKLESTLGRIKKFYLNDYLPGFKEWRAAVHAHNVATNAPAKMPFENTWGELLLKKVIDIAVENDAKSIRFPTGTQVADALGIERHYRYLFWEPDVFDPWAHFLLPEGTYTPVMFPPTKKGGRLRSVSRGTDPDLNEEAIAAARAGEASGQYIFEDELEGWIGKDYAERLLEMSKRGERAELELPVDVPSNTSAHKLYDGIFPPLINKYVKKWGLKLEKLPERPGRALVDGGYRLMLNDDIKSDIKKQGQAIFMLAGAIGLGASVASPVQAMGEGEPVDEAMQMRGGGQDFVRVSMASELGRNEVLYRPHGSDKVHRTTLEKALADDLRRWAARKQADVDGYDYTSARAAGLTPDEAGHWPSRIPSGPNEGLILKSENHPTFHKTVAADRALGYKFYRDNKRGRLYSFPSNPGKGFTKDEILNLPVNSKDARMRLRKILAGGEDISGRLSARALEGAVANGRPFEGEQLKGAERAMDELERRPELVKRLRKALEEAKNGKRN